MSIATVTYITLNDTDKIGLSDTLDNYSIDTIKASGYVGAYDPLRTNCRTAEKRSMWSGMEEQKTPYNPEWTGTPYPWSHKIYAGDGAYTGAVFIAVVWLYRTIPGLTAKVINESNIEDYKLVTEMPANKLYYTVPSLSSWNSQVCAASWSEERTYPSSYYAPDTGTLDYHSAYGDAGDISVQVDDVYPYMMFEYDGYLYFQLMTQQYDYYASWMINSETSSDWDITPYGSSALTPFTEDNYISLSTAYNASARSAEANSLGGCDFNTIVPYDGSSVWAGPANYTEVYGGAIDASGKYLPFYCYGGAGSYYSTYRCFATLATKADSLLYFGNSGVKIIADKPYKPIIVNGVVTGITDDMTEASELDGWDMGATDHGVSPSGPPVPPPGDDEDNKDPISTAGAPFASGLCHYYALTAGSVLLDHISDALGTWDIENTHKDLYKNLVSCKLVKPPAPIPTTGSAPFTIYGVKPQYGGADISLPVVSGNPDASFGPYSISRKFGDFRDYAPYTRVSIYLPYCGWCDLPSHVVGKQVSVKYFTDIIAATCKAVVFCGNNIIAEAAGVIGLDIPFVADNVGAKMQAVTAGMIAALGGGIQLGAGIGSMVSSKSGSGAKAALSGASQYISGYTQMAMAFNENTTEISGKNGDGCCLSGATNIIIKIVRPKKGSYTTAPYTPPGYGHNIGYVSQKQVKVSSVSGLLIADNVDTSGIAGATDAERAEIKRVLETGLIVNAAPAPE